MAPRNDWYAGMARIMFSSDAMMKEALQQDGWRRATRDVWFRILENDIEFVLTSRVGGRGVPAAVFHSRKSLSSDGVAVQHSVEGLPWE